MEKLCIFCKHFDWEGIEYTYYSTLTGGSMEGGASCRKDHFVLEKPDNEEEMRILFLNAKECPDYLPPIAP